MADDQPSEALEDALKALNRRERTVAELGSWLEARGHDDAEVEAALEELLASGAVDDDRYARLFSEDKRELNGWGAERIAAALAERGVEAALVERYAFSGGHEEECERAADLLAQRGEPLEDDRARARALGFLTRRGFSYEVAYAAVSRAEGAG